MRAPIMSIFQNIIISPHAGRRTDNTFMSTKGKQYIIYPGYYQLNWVDLATCKRTGTPARPDDRALLLPASRGLSRSKPLNSSLWDWEVSRSAIQLDRESSAAGCLKNAQFYQTTSPPHINAPFHPHISHSFILVY